MYKVII